MQTEITIACIARYRWTRKPSVFGCITKQPSFS